MIKGLIAGFLGMLFAVVGPAPIDMTPRYTFGLDLLQCGFALLPVLIGLFAVSQIFRESGNPKTILVPEVKEKNTLLPLSTFKGEWLTIIKSALIGFFIGVLPGIGAATANIVSYGQAKSSSPHPERFGTGCASGIIASESANNGTIGGALVPLLTMGIPGDAVTAVLLGALMIHGIQPGPLLFDHHPDIVYAIFVCVALANIFMFILMVFGMKCFIRILNFPKKYLLPVIMAFCVIGCYALNNQLSDVWSLIIFGGIGYILEKYNFPLVPVILGVVLEPIIEINLRQGLMGTAGNWLPIFTRPISLMFILVAVIALVFGVFGNPFSRRKQVK
jgi:putative tricarboxylic transport membrane protein